MGFDTVSRHNFRPFYCPFLLPFGILSTVRLLIRRGLLMEGERVFCTVSVALFVSRGTRGHVDELESRKDGWKRPYSHQKVPAAVLECTTKLHYIASIDLFGQMSCADHRLPVESFPQKRISRVRSRTFTRIEMVDLGFLQ